MPLAIACGFVDKIPCNKTEAQMQSHEDHPLDF